MPIEHGSGECNSSASGRTHPFYSPNPLSTQLKQISRFQSATTLEHGLPLSSVNASFSVSKAAVNTVAVRSMVNLRRVLFALGEHPPAGDLDEGEWT